MSDEYRSAGAIVSLKTILEPGENWDQIIQAIVADVAGRHSGVKVEVVFSGERPAFDWEVPKQRNET